MQYYDHSLQQFFNQSKNEPWFVNTTFIFCSDHWLFPEGKKGTYTPVASYRIPIIIYKPSDEKKKISNKLASQFDIAETILSTAGYRDSIISYGNDLTDSRLTNKYVYSRSGNTLYLVRDSSYVLGFNSITNKAEFLYNYKKDIHLTQNLFTDKNSSATMANLLMQVQAFLQKASAQYNGNISK
jgi:phosphoglycerol transferase MdoB-like AlkP superfamily enzyme